MGFQALDKIFIKVAGCGDGSIIKTGSSQHLVGFFGKVCKVTAVDTDSVVFQLDTLFTHFFEYTDCIGNTGFQDIVGVNQKSAGIRVKFRISLKCGVLVREAHDPGMCMSSKNRNVKHLAGQHVGSTCTSADHCSSGSEDSGIRTLGTAKTEFHDRITLGCVAYAGCLGSDEALMVHDVQDCGFHKLRFHDRCDNFDHWFSREDYGSFRNCVDITGEFEVA